MIFLTNKCMKTSLYDDMCITATINKLRHRVYKCKWRLFYVLWTIMAAVTWNGLLKRCRLYKTVLIAVNAVIRDNVTTNNNNFTKFVSTLNTIYFQRNNGKIITDKTKSVSVNAHISTLVAKVQSLYLPCQYFGLSGFDCLRWIIT